MSSPSTAKTEESSPDGVQEPVITSPAFSELNITWSLPLQPNGKSCCINLIQWQL